MKRYVLGFLFNEARNSVVLIEKQKPDWQRGLLNGVGGKIEDGESDIDAMRREFKEETGVDTSHVPWRMFCNMIGSDFQVICFMAVSQGAYRCASTKTDEKVIRVYGADCAGVKDFHHVSNVPWLIEMALDENNGKHFQAMITYG